MQSSGVKFGTSGARGLTAALTARVAYAYASAFLQHLEQRGALGGPSRVALAGDRRESTPRILAAVARAVMDAGHEPVLCGKIPSPALALFGLEERIPSIMITGSHIPEDRNGIKFNTPSGEITKEDERGIAAQVLDLPAIFDAGGALLADQAPVVGTVRTEAAERYVRRYVAGFGSGALNGLRLALYGHSAVGRELLERILMELGAEVTRLAFSEQFVSVDTEAIRPEDVSLAAEAARELSVDSVVSTDGDSDRPLISDEHGSWIRGDVAGILVAEAAQASCVVTPVTSNTALEASGLFPRVIRTRIGSPHVLEQMSAAASGGESRVVGYEANGGFLSASPLLFQGEALSPLPTRDAALVIVSLLARVARSKQPLSALAARLPARFTASDRLPDFPTERSQSKLRELEAGGPSALDALFARQLAQVRSIDTIDGLRATLANGEIVHLRASGNAPELRCYAEADSAARATALTATLLSICQSW